MSREEKVTAQLDEYLRDSKFYEAQQLYQSIYFRLATRKKYEEGAAILVDGALKLIQYGQLPGAAHLTNQLLECYRKAGFSADAQRIGEVLRISAEFGKATAAATNKDDTNRQLHIRFLKSTLKWSTEAPGGTPNGSAAVHSALIALYLETEDFGKAHKHFLRCNRPEEHAKILAAWRHKGYRSEQDLLIARAVLEYLCLEDVQAAKTVFKAYQDICQLSTPLTHFLEFLLLTVERDAGPLYEMLRQKYAISLARDSAFNDYLDKIGELFFDIKPPPSLLDGLLASSAPASSSASSSSSATAAPLPAATATVQQPPLVSPSS